jgi:hypothetical protein
MGFHLFLMGVLEMFPVGGECELAACEGDET